MAGSSRLAFSLEKSSVVPSHLVPGDSAKPFAEQFFSNWEFEIEF